MSMKIKKVILFIFAIFLLGSFSANAATVTDSVTVTVITTGVCTNGATNFPACTSCSDGSITTKAIACPPPVVACTNGATNAPLCTLCADGSITTKAIACPPPVVGVPSGSLSGPSCTIATGASSCTTTLTLNINNPVAGAATNITKAGNVEVAAGISPATKTNIKVDFSGTEFFLNHNAQTLASVQISSACKAGDEWNGSTCDKKAVAPVGSWSDWSSWSDCTANACGTSGTKTRTRTCSVAGACGSDDTETVACTANACQYSATISATPASVKKGHSTVITWSSVDMDSCYPAGVNSDPLFKTNNTTSGTYTTPLLDKSTTYSIECKALSGATRKDSFQVKVDTTIIEEI